MALDREAIYVALESALGSIPGLVSPCSRIFQDAAHVDPSQQPAMFLEQNGESRAGAGVKGLPAVFALHATIIIYARTDPDNGIAASSVLNPILTAIETALSWQGGDNAGMSVAALTTLKGLLIKLEYHGDTIIHENVATRQGYAIVPLSLIATGGG